MSYYLNLEIILVISSALAVIFSVATRHIKYSGPNTDNVIMGHAAAQSHKWRWLSDLHKYTIVPFKTSMKNVSIILISVFQKILKNKETDHPYVTLGGTMVAFSSVLVFLIGSNYWNPITGLFLGLLLLLSFWLWEVSLYGGQANVATALFLLSVYFIQQINTGNLFSPSWWLIIAGGLMCLTQFASASALKYMPLFFGAVIFEKYQLAGIQKEFLGNDYFFFTIIILALVLLGWILTKLSYKKVVALMYQNKGPAFLNKMIRARDKFGLDHYQQNAKKKLRQIFSFTSFVLISFILLLNLLGFSWILLIMLGFLTVFLALNLPNIKESFGHYFALFKISHIQRKTHFRCYVDFFAKQGISVEPNKRGGGLSWVPKIFFRMAPIHTIVFISGLIFFIFSAAIAQNTNLAIGGTLVLLLSLSPLLWAELTQAAQISRSYSPGLVGLLLFIGYSASLFLNTYDNQTILFLILGLTALVNARTFFSDIYPSRIAIDNLMKKVDSLKIKKIYTYKTNYNKNFVEGVPGIAVSDFMPDEHIPAPFEVVYINSLAEVTDGWIAIPGTSSKAINMSCDREAIADGDYTKDPILNHLLETRKIEKIATAKFKTYGTSKIGVHEDEVPTYRDLILHEVTENDRWRGHAWLLHTDNLKKYLNNLGDGKNI